MENNTNVENPVVADNNTAAVVENPAVESNAAIENNAVENVFAASDPVVNDNANNVNVEGNSAVIMPNLNNNVVVENNDNSATVNAVNDTTVVENSDSNATVNPESNAVNETIPASETVAVENNNEEAANGEGNHNIKIIDIDGVEKEVELLCYFTLKSNNKKYVAYTDNNEDENGNVIISTAEVIEKEDNTIEFVGISEPVVLDEVKKVLLDLAK